MKKLLKVILLSLAIIGNTGCNVAKHQLKKANVLDAPCGERIYTISQKLKVLPDTSFNGNPIYVYDHKYHEDTGRMLELQFFDVYVDRLRQEDPNPCYERLTKKDIRKILGTPTIIEEDGSFKYLMHFDRPCEGYNPYEKYCYYLECQFDKKGILSSIKTSPYMYFGLDEKMFIPERHR